MTRAIDDTTSTCRSCMYWDGNNASTGLPKGSGYCGYISVPAWVGKHLTHRDDHRVMLETDGLDCWQHAKRDPKPLGREGAERLLRSVARRSANVCRLCGHEHNMMPCPPPDSAENGKGDV